MDDRHLTVIIVPHGELDMRSFQFSYRRIRLLFVIAVALLLVVCVFLALWFPALTQAARVPGLERELAELEKERAKVAELAQTLAEVEAQYEKVRQMLGADAPANGQSPTLPPLRAPGGTRSGGSGTGDGEPMAQAPAPLTVWPLQARGFITRAQNARTQHPGLDIATTVNTPVRAAGDGTVLAAGEDEVYGRYVVVDHGGDLQTLYGHASRVSVREGERVRAGQVIALSGSTGRSTGPHLHFEVRRGGRAVDPQEYVKQP